MNQEIPKQREVVDVELAYQVIKNDVERFGVFTETMEVKNGNLLEEGYSGAHILASLEAGFRKAEYLYVLAARLEETYPEYSVNIDESVEGRIIFSVTKKQKD